VIGKYTQAVDANWDDRILFPESVPHLFHFDLLYLWMLEKDRDRRPRTWRDRIEGWHYLTALFLLGEVYVEEEPLREPFLVYTRPFGIEKVSWLVTHSSESPERLGVLSPTVLVRPLPDFTGIALSRWQQTFGDLTKRTDEIRHFVGLAVSRLREGESQAVPSFRTRLAAVLDREFGRQPMANSPSGRDVTVPVLRSLGWARPRLEAEGPVQVNLLVRESGGLQARVYVPRCTTCNELLTRTSEEAPVEVRGAAFQLSCPKGHSNELSLADFLIWYRGNGQVVAWRDDRQVPLERGVPPLRTIRGIQIDMEWNTGNVAGDRRRFLRLSFPEMAVSEHRLEEIFFDQVVVPGRLENFRGLPIRPEWIDALENPGQVVPEVDTSIPKIRYRGLRLGGWPVPVPKNLGGLSLQIREDLALGIYPDPLKVGSDWKWFRVFLDGPGRREYRLICANGDPVLPWVVEVTNSAPELVSLESASDPQTGVGFYSRRPTTEPVAGLPTSKADIGVDFGTSNTLIAFHRLGLAGDRSQIETLRPKDLLLVAGWLAPPAGTWQGSIADFLPARDYRASTDDDHLIPSALWMISDQQARYVVRWDSHKPIPSAEPLAGFKWDPEGGSFKRERYAYLLEVLLLTLPASLSQMSRTRRVTEVTFGFAFPLAFTQGLRDRMLELFEDLKKDLLRLTGLTTQFVHISESAACVRAFGKPKYGETYLVADMGGGTIDLVLFQAKEEGVVDIHQIGSLRFAGEHYIQALAIKKGGKAGVDDFVWQLRDSIANGRARGEDPDAERILNRLVIFALEFLRTMVLAQRKQHEGLAIRLVLVGNGWHLADALQERAEEIGARPFFLEFYHEFMERLGETNLSIYDEGPVKELPSSKHLIVRGALINTVRDKRQELRDEASPSKLPAGRTMILNPPERPSIRIGWEQIIGKAGSVALVSVPRTDLQGEYLDFELNGMPPLSASWRDEVLRAFGIRAESAIPYPSKEQLRDLIEIKGNRIERGPLQVILEECWREELSR
jgi:hypothetical protein